MYVCTVYQYTCGGGGPQGGMALWALTFYNPNLGLPSQERRPMERRDSFGFCPWFCLEVPCAWRTHLPTLKCVRLRICATMSSQLIEVPVYRRWSLMWHFSWHDCTLQLAGAHANQHCHCHCGHLRALFVDVVQRIVNRMVSVLAD